MTIQRRALLSLAEEDLDRLSVGRTWSIGDCVAAACLLEATAPKAGNVHPTAPFGDMDYEDFRQSARIVGRVFDEQLNGSCGELILAAVNGTRKAVGKNTNLGMVLLLGPLAKSVSLRETRKPLKWPIISGKERSKSFREAWRRDVEQTLHLLSAEDSAAIYRAIATAKPGGLGHVESMDVAQEAPHRILEAMSLAAAWDDIAKQYVEGFSDVFALSARLDRYRDEYGWGWMRSLATLQIDQLAERGDSLIARKNGPAIAAEVVARARKVRDAKEFFESVGGRRGEWLAFDRFLRADGHRRNPGTTADLLAAVVLVSLIAEYNDSDRTSLNSAIP